MPDFRTMRTGRLPCSAYVLSQAPQLSRYVRAFAPPPPSLKQRAAIPYAPRLDRNDELGDCGAVGIANGARADAALRGFGLDIPTERVVSLYSRGGYQEGRPETDNGLVLVNVLQGMVQKAWNAGDQLPLTGPWATVDPDDRTMLARCMDKLGWLYTGVDLAPADMTAELWDTSLPASAGDPVPRPDLGHCIDLLWYDGLGDDDLVHVATWGIVMRATWRWLHSRLREAHIVAWRPLAGLDYDMLSADVTSFGRALAA